MMIDNARKLKINFISSFIFFLNTLPSSYETVHKRKSQNFKYVRTIINYVLEAFIPMMDYLIGNIDQFAL